MSCEVPSLSFAELPDHPVAAQEGSQKIYFIAGTMYVRGTGAPELFLVSQGVSPYIMTLLIAADAPAAQSTLDLEPGVDVQAWSATLDSFVANASYSGADLTLGANVTVNGVIMADGGVSVTAGNLLLYGAVSIDGSGTMTTADVIIPTTLFMTNSSGPTVTAGTAVPSAALPDGSIYLRSGSPNGSLYVRQNGVWTLK